MKIVVAGFGPVGKAVKHVLDRHRNISTIVDDPRLGFHVGADETENVAGVVVCVATPMSDDGTCYTQNVKDVFEKYEGARFLIKSAVDPLWLCMYAEASSSTFTCSPEFLRGSHVHANPTEEFLHQEFAIYGGDDCRFWEEIFTPLLPSLKEIKYCSLEQASFAKYVENTFLATKVTFFNEMYKIYHEIGFEGFDQMVDVISMDPRVGRSHTQVPGPDGKFGYGGHCLPKDIAALRSLSMNTPLLDAVSNINEENRNESK